MHLIDRHLNIDYGALFWRQQQNQHDDHGAEENEEFQCREERN